MAIWKHASEANPPPLDPLDYGWTKNEWTNSLMPIGVTEDVSISPDDILKLIKCSCDSTLPCKTKRCNCQSNNMACIMFCACRGGETWYNDITRELLGVQKTNEDVGRKKNLTMLSKGLINYYITFIRYLFPIMRQDSSVLVSTAL